VKKSKKRNGTLQIPLLCAHINDQKRKNVVPAFQLVLDYLDTHFAEWDISAKQVSEAVGIGINRVNSIVREQTGNSCKSYITRLRLKKACQMLAETDKPVFEIAEQVGYSSASYFIRVFKESLGETPESYRKSPHPFVS
jgi:YesN/AraC family two-component response regulator